MKIENLKVYDTLECFKAAGYPMRTEIENSDHLEEKDVERAFKLVKASNGNGAHGQFLTGIRVNFDLTCSNKMWVEAERYRFLEFVSSQSTMHRITKFDIKSQCNEYVDPRVIAIAQEKIDAYNADPRSNKEKVDMKLAILYNIPSGFELTARMTTNYRCLLNIYIQRHNHELPEWREFCEYIKNNLPFFNLFIKAYNQEEFNEALNAVADEEAMDSTD